ncbi:Pentatricopeptide repeat [Macleaya cordata]|uniref:Pentatricopeptide repeat n=1 Tax=Macleaya cordata TaxID=56857 RepID=A0A200R0W6_MACCD|nr:Pentatricopeptide repeat [Macleaya cordata]
MVKLAEATSSSLHFNKSRHRHPCISLFFFSLSHLTTSYFSSSSTSHSPQDHHPPPHFLHHGTAFTLKNGLITQSNFNFLVFPTVIVPDVLLSYFTAGHTLIALSLFRFHFESNLHFLNSTFKHFSDSKLFNEILDLYCLLRLSNSNTTAKPDTFTFPYVLKACASLFALKEGLSLHTQILKLGFGDNIFVANSLIDMYSKFGSLHSARKTFDGMPTKNLVSWNSMISGYVLNGFPHTALELCNLMKFHGIKLDKVSFKIVLPACSQLRAIRLGKSVHAHIIISGFSSDLILVTAVLHMYAKCGNLEIAEKIFEELQQKDVVSWNAMISGYSKTGQLEMVLKFFHRMQVESSVSPSFVTVLVTLQACADSAKILFGETVHGYITKLGLSSDTSVEVLLINMYSKCGKLNLAFQIFNGVTREGLNSWSALIHGIGMHGYGKAALMAFFKMLKRGIDPDGLCFLLVLSSCSHTGLVKEGRKVFYYMIREFGIVPTMEHYATIVDVLGRAGLIDEAFRFIEKMPLEPDISVWGAFLGACRIHDDFKMGKLYGEQVVVQSDPKTAGYYKLLLSIYASKGIWDEVFKIRNLIEEKGVYKALGCSLIEINS